MYLRIKQVVASILVLGLVFCGMRAPCANAQPAKVEATLQALLDSVAANPAIPGALLAVDAPGLSLLWQGASGVAETSSDTPLQPDAPVRIASNTKTYVASAVLRLWEMDRLALDDPISEYLTDEQAAPLRDDGYQLEAITLRHLLTHTAGLIDHAATQNYFAAILANPQRRWKPEDQIRGAADWGAPLGPPGAAFSYSDTGYVLLGLVIEHVTGQSLAASVRDLLGFKQIGLGQTWWETLEPAPEGLQDRAHQYIGAHDTYAWDPSLDLYGGGGLVASVGDLALFWRALFTGAVFDEEATLDTLLTTPVNPSGLGYRMGIAVRDFGGLRAYEHSGFWGTVAVYVPSLELVVAAAVTQQEQGRAVFGLARAAIKRVQAAMAMR